MLGKISAWGALAVGLGFLALAVMQIQVHAAGLALTVLHTE